MADIQVTSIPNIARKSLPKARKCVPQLQEITCQEDQNRSEVLQECGSEFQDSKGGH